MNKQAKKQPLTLLVDENKLEIMKAFLKTLDYVSLESDEKSHSIIALLSLH